MRAMAVGSAARGEQRQRWWQRAWSLIHEDASTPQAQAERLEHTLAVLEAARGQVAAGWVQGGWWSVASPDGERRVTGGVAAAATPPDQVQGACLVGALVQGGHRTSGGKAEIGTAVDLVYDALWESLGSPAAPGLPPVSAPHVRLARVQILTKWNDESERTQVEVLEVLDRAIARAVQGIVALPGVAAEQSGRVLVDQ